ncbi:MAG: DNA polymerase III subunit beta [Xanthomonadales bacterium]|nr:DNA polymerase III subunit beta [Xanthomonadales bacterium]
MQFTLQREALLKPLQQVINVVEKRQSMPVLGNLLVRVDADGLSLTGSDSEVEMSARTVLETASTEGETTVPARKFFDIVRSLPDGATVKFDLSADRATVRAGRSRFTLATLPASDFPLADDLEVEQRVRMTEGNLSFVIERTAFAMAQQDVRYYLNGLLFDLEGSRLRAVATTGHRMALCEAELEAAVTAHRQLILPRKGVLELQRLFDGADRAIVLEVGRSLLRVRREDVTFTSKLIEGRFPDYNAVIPIGVDKRALIDREALKAALQRVAILSNEKYRGVKLEFSPNQLRIAAHNPEQEEAVEEIDIETSIDQLSVGFNVVYMLETINSLRDETVSLSLRDANSSALVQEGSNTRTRHVVMPMRL